MPFITDQNGFTYYQDDTTGKISTPVDQPAPVPEPAPSEPTQGETWKPDFNQSDPWAGMPKDYNGIGTFTPTDSNPTPPWEQSKTTDSGTKEVVTPADIPKFGTPEYQERAREIAEKQLKPYMSGQNIDVEAVVKAGKVEYLRGVGIDEKTVKEIQEYAQNRGKPTKEEKEQADALDAIKTYRADDGSYDLVGAIRAGHIADVRKAGFDSMDIVEAQSLAAMRPVVARAMENLAPYTDKDGMVDGAKYLRFHPEDAATLRTAGFDTDTVNQWQEWADRPAVRANAIDRYNELLAQAGVKPIPATLDTVLDKKTDVQLGDLAITLGYDTRDIKAYRQALKDNPELAKARDAMLADVRKNGKAKPDLSVDGFTQEYVSVRGDTQANRDAAGLVYKSLYGTRATLTSAAEKFTADYVFAPARALYPEVDTKDITLREWGMGVVQIGLVIAPGASAIGGTAGKAIMAGTEGTAAGLMTAGIAKDWNTMTPSERALNIGIDTLVLASAVNRVIPLRKTAEDILTKAGSKAKVDPAATQATVSKALVKLGGNKPDVDAALTQIRQGIQNNDRAMLQAGAKRLELVSGQVPKQLGGKALEDYSKNLLKNPDDYLRLGKGEGLKAADLERVNEGLKANKEHLDMINRQLEKTKNDNLKRTLQTERERVQKIVKTQEKTKLAAQERVIMPEEQGRNVPAKRTSTALVVRERPAPKASKTSTALVVREKEALATMRGKAAPPGAKTKTATSTANPKAKPRQSTYRDIEAPGYQPSRQYQYVPMTQPLPKTLTVTRTKTFPYTETKTQTETQTKTVTAPYPETRTQPQPKTKPAPETKTKPDTETQPKPDTKTKTEPKPGLETPTPGATDTTTKTPKLPRLDGQGRQKPLTQAEIASAVAWKQGMGVWAVKEPYTNEGDNWRFYRLDELPEGLHISKNIHEARKTIQLYRGTKGPEFASRDLGIVFVDIRSPSKQPGRAGALGFRIDRRDAGRRRTAAPKVKARVSKDIFSRKGMISHVKRHNSKRVSRGGIIRG